MRAAGARRARSGIFFHGSISFAETLPTRYRTSMGGFAKCVLLTRQAGRDPDPERHYQNIYIDDPTHFQNESLHIIEQIDKYFKIG